MTSWEMVRPYLPQAWAEALAALPPGQQEMIQELRLRAEQPVSVSTPSGERYLCRRGLTAMRQPGLFVCTGRQLEAAFLRFCEESVYAHETELRQGYIAVPGGLRVGIAGTAAPGGVSRVTSLCVRLPRHHAGCAATLLPLVKPADGWHSTLLVGEPSSGKTSLLRDLADQLSARHHRVAVVDERGEIAGVGGLPGCDVLRGYDKARGIRQAVRCLAPEIVLFDELGDEQEIEAVAACAHAGVAVAASLHGCQPTLLQRKPVVRRLIEQEMFDNWVFLTGRQAPGQWTRCLQPEVVQNEICWHMVDRGSGYGSGPVLFPALVPAGAPSAGNRAAVGDAGTAPDLYSVAADTAVAAVGGR